MSAERKKLVKKLDKVFGDYIKERDGNKCVICNMPKEAVRIDPGHLITRASFATRWDEENCFAQCRGCNLTHEYRPEIMTNWFIQKFGQKKYELLYIKSRKPPKFSEQDLKYMIDYYKDKLKHLRGEE